MDTIDATDPFNVGSDPTQPDTTGDALSSIDMNSISATAANIASVASSVSNSVTSIQGSIAQVQGAGQPVVVAAPRPSMMSGLSTMSTAEKIMIVIAIGAVALVAFKGKV